MRRCLLLVTLETKSEESSFLTVALAALGVPVDLCDTSLGAEGAVWDGAKKTARIETVAEDVADRLVTSDLRQVGAVVALGGGTGGDIALRIMARFPEGLQKLLISPMPFDPRPFLADTPITLVPSVVDIAGLNPTLRQVLGDAAAMIAGLCAAPEPHSEAVKTIGLTALSATGPAAENITAALRVQGHEVTTFHANGFGGAGFARFCARGVFSGVIDMTCHELTRMALAGDHVDMPDRFTAAGNTARVVLPGGLNFLGLGSMASLLPDHRTRPLFQHSGLFTHVKLTQDEMAQIAQRLADALNQGSRPARVLVPMGGFSHRDCPGGELEDPELRNTCLDVLTQNARRFCVKAIPHHINAPETAQAAVAALNVLLQE
ncbi:MAG: Tm-1-like ATP-binding domain-containing protein [Litoreibacter sp.]|nr:Tm-1-like ATP-binding domain-containing protein [Litoreibacter sp.]MCY4334438.1 Tm-1-like ATP-binding domain-containing protein [Litoreibacter sp.]